MPFSGTILEVEQILGAERVAPEGALDKAAGNFRCNGVTTDSREVKPGAIFFARQGETSDGHNFLPDAARRGAAVCVVETKWTKSDSKTSRPKGSELSGPVFLAVDDTTKALGKLARTWREKLELPVLVVTGSNGKTTTKEIIRVLLESAVGPGTANLKSLNNHVGLPQTILNADSGSRWLLLEAGMNHPGELDYLGGIAMPDTAAILNIGMAHLEFFSTLAAIADAKCELLAHLRSGGRAVLRYDDQELGAGVSRLEKRLGKTIPRVTFGLDEKADFSASGIKILGAAGSEFTLHHASQSFAAKLLLLGSHNVNNALAAIAMVHTRFPELELGTLVHALQGIKPAPMRLELESVGALKVLVDCYNANPISMAAALETVAQISGGAGFGVVVGDMLELGPESSKFHNAVGLLAAKLNAKIVIALGEHAMSVVRGANEAGLKQAWVASSPQDAVRFLLEKKGTSFGYLLIKGSRGMALERVFTALKEARQ